MFKIHIGDTPNKLTDNDYTLLVNKTKNYSGLDISRIVVAAKAKSACRILDATHFKLVIIYLFFSSNFT